MICKNTLTIKYKNRKKAKKCFTQTIPVKLKLQKNHKNSPNCTESTETQTQVTRLELFFRWTKKKIFHQPNHFHAPTHFNFLSLTSVYIPWFLPRSSGTATSAYRHNPILMNVNKSEHNNQLGMNEKKRSLMRMYFFVSLPNGIKKFFFFCFSGEILSRYSKMSSSICL